VTHIAPGFIAGNVSVYQPYFAAFRFNEGLSQINSAGSYGFNLGSGKNYTGFEFVLNKIVVIGSAIGSYCFFSIYNYTIIA
jgi:hypothetical protein